jgi:diguanylate cyclase (GGDEF)-like protein/PAS domain S-box-containing protein
MYAANVLTEHSQTPALSPVVELLFHGKHVAGAEDIGYRRLLEELPVAIYTTDAAGRVTYFNRAAAELAGRTPELGIDEWCVTWKLFSPDGTPLPHDQCPTAVALRENRPIRGVQAIAERPDGTRFWFTPCPTPLNDSSGRIIGAINMLIDLTDHKAAEQRLVYVASSDALTDLPGRGTYETHLSDLVSDPAGASQFALVALDLDNLRDVNDGFGRTVGDEVLRIVGQRLNSLPPDIFRARVGGDEFMLILDGEAGDLAIARMIEQLDRQVRQDVMDAGHVFQLGFSAGVTRYPRDAAGATDLAANADAALRRAKRDGAGSIRFFQAEKDRQIPCGRLLKQDLRDAIGTDALTLHFQPQARPGGEIIGFEALVRWVHPLKGNVPPDEFIPMAEESGLIIGLSRWILRAACAEAATWDNQLKVSVNISPVQFQQEDLPVLVRSILAETGLQPGRLMLEVTEGLLIADYGRAMKVLSELAGLGVKISLDDFGKGYSSLSYLQAFPFAEIKIDRSFTANLGISARSDAIVRSVIDLGHALDLRVVVEGVETLDQLNILAETACDCVQGYLIGRPNPIKEFASITGKKPRLKPKS